MRVLLIANSGKNNISASLDRAAAWLEQQGVTYDHITSERLLAGDPQLLCYQQRINDYGLVCCFGGDGTILRVARLIGTSGVPLLSINFGLVGFLTSTDESRMIQALEAALEQRITIDTRILAAVEVQYSDGSIDRQTALNEVGFSRGNFGRIVSVDLFVNGCLLENVRGDGMLVSTATGSTAYSLSAGGPLITPRFGGLTIVPISPHTLNSRSVVTAPDDLVVLRPDQESLRRIVLFVDGEVLWKPWEGDEPGPDGDRPPHPGVPELVEVRVRPSQAGLNILRYGDYDFFEQISRVFFRGANA
ncbi:MAG: NAD(+)/NADH kinase [Actinomycetia bacterium]|nr:NAD(+)/NADH kinase [Actinomycetes bacterium]